jgi:chaperonin GroEL
MLHDEEARAALGRGVAKLAKAVVGTLGPCGMNVIIDRPLGAPVISRDGVSVAQEIDLECPFENIGVQVAREVSRQTNEVAGDGTTTATALAAALVEAGLHRLRDGAVAVELVRGMERARDAAIEALRGLARPVGRGLDLRAVATIAANDPATGALVAEALERVGPSGVIDVEYGLTVETRLEIVDGIAFDRGYISRHMVTDIERLQAVLEEPLILLTDMKLRGLEELAVIETVIEPTGRPLLLVAEDIAPACIVQILRRGDRGLPPIVAIHPPDYGHWRKDMLEDLAIATGGRVIAAELGGALDRVSLSEFGEARRVVVTAEQTTISGGCGDQAVITARREQIRRQYDMAPPNVERDKLQLRLSRLAGGTALILVGGATQVEQKRRAQLVEDAVNATRAAMEEGVVAGGGTALLQAGRTLGPTIDLLEGDARLGAMLLREALAHPLACIARNAGIDPEPVLRRVANSGNGHGLDARSGEVVDMFAAGIIDAARVGIAALRNAVSVAALILTTQTLIAANPEVIDPTRGPARGGGAERF